MNHAGWFAKDTAYSDPALPYILSVLSFTALISGFNSTKLATSNRHLNMGKIVQVELLSQIGALTVMIAWAVLQKSIWALVAGSIAGALIKLILSHILLTGISNQFHWNAEAFSEIFHFGKWVFLSSILGFFAVNGDRIMLGGLVDAATMGQFGIAFVMASAVRLIIEKIIGLVAFPVLSEVVRTRPGDLRQTYYKLRLPIDILLLFLTGLMFTAGHLLIELLYDERYHDAGWMLEILSIGLVQVQFSLAEQCYLAMGKPRLLVPVRLIQMAGVLILLPLCFNAWGLVGAVWIAGGAVLLPLPLTIYLKAKYGIFLLRRELYVIPFLFLGLAVGSLISAGM
jgi:O-antigen/teichoic acid export membrane protein